MKKLLSAMLALMLMVSLLPGALGECYEVYEAVIACGLTEKTELRVMPDADAAPLGLFYPGTPVTVLDDGMREGYALVRIGRLNGYLPAESLMRKNRNYGAPELFFTAEVRFGETLLRDAPRNGKGLNTVFGRVYVLGETADGWRYVADQDMESFGYVRAGYLTGEEFSVDRAFLTPADGGDEVTLYRDRGLTEPAAVCYAGSTVRVLACSPDGWAEVVCYACEDIDNAYGTVEGYVAQRELRVFCQRWEVKNLSVKGTAKEDIRIADGSVTAPRGAALAVAGETEKEYQIVYADPASLQHVSSLVPKDVIETAGQRADGQNPPRIAFGHIENAEGDPSAARLYAFPGGEEIDLAEYALFEILAEGDTWYQARQAYRPNFFLDREGTATVTRLYPENAAERGAGVWTAGAEDAGLWLLTADSGETAELTLAQPRRETAEEYAVRADENYTVLISEGTEVTLRGGGRLIPAAAGSLPRLVDEHPADTAVETEVFTGSGRFFCDLQVPDKADFFGWRVKAAPGAEDSWLEVADLFGCGDGRIVLAGDGKEMTEERPDFDGQYVYLDLFPGQFLEVHDCVVEISYGNG